MSFHPQEGLAARQGRAALAGMNLVLDWDGTVTAEDSLHVAILRFGDPEVYRSTEERLGRRLTLHEVIAVEMETITAPLEEVVAHLVEHVAVRPGFRELVERFDPLIVSAGFHELIEPILAREGLRTRVLANSIEADPAGWRATFRDEEPCDVCGEPCKRAAVAEIGRFAYAGDGYSDRCIALAADRVFARDGLAAWLDARGLSFEPYADLRDVAVRLA